MSPNLFFDYSQNPQCAGIYEGRSFFDSKFPLTRRKAFEVQYQEETGKRSGKYILHAGTIQKVTPKSNFALFDKNDSMLAHQLGTLSVINNHIGEWSSQATIATLSGQKLDPALDIVAVRIKSGAENDLKVFIRPDDKLRGVCKRLQGDLILDNITLADDPQDANVEITTSQGEASFILRSLPHPGLGPFEWKQTVNIDLCENPAELVHILSRAAHFYRELKLVDNDTHISKNIQVNFYKLIRTSKYRFEPVRADNLCKNGIINVSHDPDVVYGIELVNKSEYTLYANLFYFVNKDLQIGTSPVIFHFSTVGHHNSSTRHFLVERVVTTPGGPHKRDSCLQPFNGTLAIGWGAAGYKPDICELDDDEDSNIEFLKIYLSTQPVNLAHLAQTSPFSGLPRGMKPFDVPQEFWTDLVIPIVQKRNAIPKEHN